MSVAFNESKATEFRVMGEYTEDERDRLRHVVSYDSIVEADAPAVGWIPRTPGAVSISPLQPDLAISFYPTRRGFWDLP